MFLQQLAFDVVDKQEDSLSEGLPISIAIFCHLVVTAKSLLNDS